MKKYCYFVSNEEVWFNVAEKLFLNKIAKPVLWLGHDSLYKKAKTLFGDDVLLDLTFRHRAHKLNEISYNGEHEDFFSSINYQTAKDRCLKMMDRLDLYSSFGRLDREVHFHYVVIWALKKIFNSKPDILICSEAPHDWPKYIIYEICIFLKIPSYKFVMWTYVPVTSLQNFRTGRFIEKKKNNYGKYENIFFDVFKQFVTDVSQKKNFVEKFLQNNNKKKSLNYKIRKLVLGDITFNQSNSILFIIKDIKHNLFNYLKSEYNPINPFNFGIITRQYIDRKRRRNLKRSISIHEEKIDLNKKFIYFPLHYEPERTTNPDGENFHDQFLALVKLRNLIPKDVNIYVKEHPAQFYNIFWGHRGRSPLFYKLVKNINGLYLVNTKFNISELILKSQFVATITGSVALESAALGKICLTFGSTWYEGCPNVISWKDNLTFEKIINHKIQSKEEILNYFKFKIEKESIINIGNASQRKFHKDIIDDEFIIAQNNSVYNSLENLFKNI